MNTYTSSNDIDKEQFKKERFSSYIKAFLSGDVSKCKFRLINNIDPTRSLSQIARDELILETDIHIQELIYILSHFYNSPNCSYLPRERRSLSDIEEDVLRTYFNNDLSQWNNYLTRIKDEFEGVHPYGVCLYIREVGLPLPIPKENSTNHSIRLSTPEEIIERIRARKKAQKKKK